MRGYHRFAGLTEQEFLTTYWDPTANGGSGGWRYPPDNGFLLDPGGTPIEFTWSLGAGQEIDRFGSEFGAFLAPEDTPYAERALPPQSLDDFDHPSLPPGHPLRRSVLYRTSWDRWRPTSLDRLIQKYDGAARGRFVG